MAIHDPVTLAVWTPVLDHDPEYHLYPSGRRCEPPPPGSDPLSVNDLRIMVRELRRHRRMSAILRGELTRLEQALKEAEREW